MLLVDLLVGPAGPIELGQDVHAAGIGFGLGHGGKRLSGCRVEVIASAT
jgi:hypothetical protein